MRTRPALPGSTLLRPALLGLLLLGATATQVPALQQEDVGAGALPPITRDYEAKINGWSRRYFIEPRTVGPAAITDPVLIRDGTGRLLWLVCLEVANPPNPAVTGAPERLAFGFAPDIFSAPHERYKTTLLRDDCDRPLAWRPFRGFASAALRDRPRPKKRRPLASR